jgi:hypothetical protein
MKIIVSIAIACPAESVFEFASDYTRDPAWRAGVIEMSQTPTGRPQLGTQTLEVARFFGYLLLVLSQQTTKILRKCEYHGNGRVTDTIQIQRGKEAKKRRKIDGNAYR